MKEIKEFETVIGLEVHVELATDTKIFCGCSTAFGAKPNTQTCPVCTGMPGALPILNRQVVEYAAAVGLALNGTITPYCKFDRKNYFYPDNPQNYQISQLYLPICRDGRLEIHTENGSKWIGIHEIHMEEDAGKLVHDEGEDLSYVDYNRSGVPLIEIVSEPDMRSAAEVIAYLEKLRTIIRYLGASDCRLQEGSMRADVNLSLRPSGSAEMGTRTEMKNLNSFKAISRAIAHETDRQADILLSGGMVARETRRWDDTKGCSFSMRSKEDAQDYRYFPEPEDISFSPEHLAKLTDLADSGGLSNTVAKEVFEKVFYEDADPEVYAQEHGLKAEHDEEKLRSVIAQVMERNCGPVKDYQNGKKKALGFLVGQTMKEMKGRANPGMVNRILQEMLDSADSCI